MTDYFGLALVFIGLPVVLFGTLAALVIHVVAVRLFNQDRKTHTIFMHLRNGAAFVAGGVIGPALYGYEGNFQFAYMHAQVALSVYLLWNLPHFVQVLFARMQNSVR